MAWIWRIRRIWRDFLVFTIKITPYSKIFWRGFRLFSFWVAKRHGHVTWWQQRKWEYLQILFHFFTIIWCCSIKLWTPLRFLPHRTIENKIMATPKIENGTLYGRKNHMNHVTWYHKKLWFQNFPSLVKMGPLGASISKAESQHKCQDRCSMLRYSLVRTLLQTFCPNICTNRNCTNLQEVPASCQCFGKRQLSKRLLSHELWIIWYDSCKVFWR